MRRMVFGFAILFVSLANSAAAPRFVEPYPDRLILMQSYPLPEIGPSIAGHSDLLMCYRNGKDVTIRFIPMAENPKFFEAMKFRNGYRIVPLVVDFEIERTFQTIVKGVNANVIDLRLSRDQIKSIVDYINHRIEKGYPKSYHPVLRSCSGLACDALQKGFPVNICGPSSIFPMQMARPIIRSGIGKKIAEIEGATSHRIRILEDHAGVLTKKLVALLPPPSSAFRIRFAGCLLLKEQGRVDLLEQLLQYETETFRKAFLLRSGEAFVLPEQQIPSTGRICSVTLKDGRVVARHIRIGRLHWSRVTQFTFENPRLYGVDPDQIKPIQYRDNGKTYLLLVVVPQFTLFDDNLINGSRFDNAD